MQNKEIIKNELKQITGWSYSDLKWLTERESVQANNLRERLLKSLSGKVNYSFMQSKIHIGNLSPGCLICGQGYWSCIFINGLCTANCFYCTQNRKIKKESLPLADVIFDNATDYVDFLEKFNFRGVGFSGGESLLVFDKLLAYIKKIKERFNKSIYVWIYTNGDLVNRDKLKKLKDAGLDEIRFNISARKYKLHCLESAINIIKTVTVEIPCVPEDYKIVKSSLRRIKEIGVDYLNIHQLVTTRYNYKNYIKRNYTFLHQSNLPILESEMSALKLMNFAIDNKINLPINYCSNIFKERFQVKGKRERKAYLIKEDFEELTGLGYIRSLSIQDSQERIKKLTKILKVKKKPANLWKLKNNRREIFIHSIFLKYIDFPKSKLIITYMEPKLKLSLDFIENAKEIALNSKKKIFLKKDIVFQLQGLSKLAIETFSKLFIKNIEEEKALDYFYRNYKLSTSENLNTMKKEVESLITMKKLEHQEIGFPKIY